MRFRRGRPGRYDPAWLAAENPEVVWTGCLTTIREVLDALYGRRSLAADQVLPRAAALLAGLDRLVGWRYRPAVTGPLRDACGRLAAALRDADQEGVGEASRAVQAVLLGRTAG